MAQEAVIQDEEPASGDMNAYPKQPSYTQDVQDVKDLGVSQKAAQAYEEWKGAQQDLNSGESAQFAEAYIDADRTAREAIGGFPANEDMDEKEFYELAGAYLAQAIPLYEKILADNGGSIPELQNFIQYSKKLQQAIKPWYQFW
jgi:hypothetical protein